MENQMPIYWCLRRMGLSLLFLILLVEKAVSVDTRKSFPQVEDTVTHNQIFSAPLTSGLYNFDDNGYIPSQPLERMKTAHAKVIDLIKSTHDENRRIDHITAMCTRINNDFTKMRAKIANAGISDQGPFDKSTMKADVFVLVVGHNVLLSRLILNFPSNVKILIGNNEGFKVNVQWAFDLIKRHNLTNMEEISSLIEMALMELEWVKRPENYENPYLSTVPSVSKTTKKPRKRLSRGPRLSGGGGEL